MKIVMETRFISSDIKFLNRYLGKQRQILQCIKIVAKNGQIKFTATNLEQSVSSTFDKFIVEDGEVCVDGKKFLSILENFKNTTVQIATDGNDVVVSNSTLSLNLPAMETIDFPPDMGVMSAAKPSEVQTIYWYEFIGIEHNKLLNALNLCMASTDDSGYNPMHNAICFNFENPYISVVSTESHMLSKYETTVKSNQDMIDLKIAVPSDVFQYVLKSKTPLKLGFSVATIEDKKFPEWFFMKTGNIEMVSRLIDGRFPDYNRIIPKTWNQEAFINVKSFLDKLVSLYKITKDKYVRMDFSSGKMKIILDGQKMEIPATYNYPDAQICFQSDFMIRYLKSIDSTAVTLRWTTPSMPGLFITDDGLGQFIIMPCTF